MALDAGIYEVTNTWSASVADFNGDAWDDLMIVRHQVAPARLYRNNQDGTFSEVNAGLFKKIDRHACTWGDANVDGLLDVYCTVGAAKGRGKGPNELWIQKSEGGFVDVAAAWGVLDVYGRGRWPTFINVNGDPYPDLFVGNGFPRQDGRSSPNRLFLNDKGQRFVEAQSYGVTLEVGAHCAQAADFDRDGWQDLLVCGNQGIILYRNASGNAFVNVTGAVGLSGQGKYALLVDLNNDRRLDLAQVRRTKFVVNLQMSTGRFAAPKTIRTVSEGRSIAAGDIDQDGDADFYVLQGLSAKDLMLVNDGSGTRFVNATIPQAGFGRGDRVSAIDYDRDGAADFVALNGADSAPGPVQLIIFAS